MDLNELRRESRQLENSYKPTTNFDLLQVAKELIAKIVSNKNIINMAELFKLLCVRKYFSGEVLNMLSSFFPYRFFFDILENCDLNEEDDLNIRIPFELLIRTIRGSSFVPQQMCNQKDIIFLIVVLSRVEYLKYALFIIAAICQADSSFVQIFYENGFLNQIANIPNCTLLSNFLIFMAKKESGSEPFFLDLIDNSVRLLFLEEKDLNNIDDITVIINGLEIVHQALDSPYESVQNKAKLVMMPYIFSNLSPYLEISNDELTLSLLEVFLNIPNLPTAFAGTFFNLTSESQNDKIVAKSSQIFLKQYKNWGNVINENLLFDVLLSKISPKFDLERMVFLTLMRFGGFNQMIRPQMISLIMRYVSYPNFSFMCLNTLYIIISSAKETDANFIDTIFGNKSNELISIAEEMVNSDIDEIADAAQKILAVLGLSEQ